MFGRKFGDLAHQGLSVHTWLGCRDWWYGRRKYQGQPYIARSRTGRSYVCSSQQQTTGMLHCERSGIIS